MSFDANSRALRDRVRSAELALILGRASRWMTVLNLCKTLDPGESVWPEEDEDDEEKKIFIIKKYFPLLFCYGATPT